jgi:hypothetical protein
VLETPTEDCGKAVESSAERAVKNLQKSNSITLNSLRAMERTVVETCDPRANDAVDWSLGCFAIVEIPV